MLLLRLIVHAVLVKKSSHFDYVIELDSMVEGNCLLIGAGSTLRLFDPVLCTANPSMADHDVATGQTWPIRDSHQRVGGKESSPSGHAWHDVDVTTSGFDAPGKL